MGVRSTQLHKAPHLDGTSAFIAFKILITCEQGVSRFHFVLCPVLHELNSLCPATLLCPRDSLGQHVDK